MKQQSKLVVIVILLFSQFIQAQSPWTKEKGKAYIQLGASGIFYNQAEIDGKTVDLNADYSDVTTQLYTEFGLTDKLEAQLIVPYKIVSVKSAINNATADLSGLGNITIGLKYKLYDQAWKVSAGLQYVANTIDYDNGLSTGFAANSLIPYLAAGTSTGKWYYFGNLGYGYMSNNYSDYVKLDAELGYNIIPKGHIILAFNSKNVISKETAFNNNSTQWPSYLDRQTYNAMGLKLNYEFTPDKFGANFSVFGAFGNDNAPLAPSLNLGIYTKI
ncbi:hypothetical protein SLW70_12215 [Flavobacterium sp. NG2]|uniref:hypothetical protein n=1 Tax=Flavobacterium sp. NG2 TaxID=3097547 RepID=UPI002A83DBD0|nr:hypothetical protein [Flavobacterium sp. NG2]WPR70694.1 hypothetical protein SLW70_12215 [Flavobacterium sp. NG2]